MPCENVDASIGNRLAGAQAEFLKAPCHPFV